MLNSSRDTTEGAHRTIGRLGGGGASYVTPDLSYQREGAEEVGQR